MRLSPRLLAAAVCASTWLGVYASTASAQTTTTVTTTTAAPAPCADGNAAAPAPMFDGTPTPLPPPVAVAPSAPYVVPSAPYVAPSAPSVAAPLPSASVLLMPQDLVLSGKGTWVRTGNELVLTHSDAPRSRRSGMIAAGIVLLSAGYTPALITGGLTLLFDSPSLTGSSLLIPVLGPFLSGLAAMSNPREMGLGNSGARVWGWSWMLVDGAVQVTGLALLIAGGRSRSTATPSFVERVQVLPYSTQNGGGVVVSGRF